MDSPKYSQLDKALVFATEQHFGQVDKAGAPYILHPLRVMFGVERVAREFGMADYFADIPEALETLRIAALMHDVVEDTGVLTDDLHERFGPIVARVVGVLTHTLIPLEFDPDLPDIDMRRRETYQEYIHRIIDSRSRLAYIVKLADLADNMDLSRLPNPMDNDYERWIKYGQARHLIAEAMRAVGQGVMP